MQQFCKKSEKVFPFLKTRRERLQKISCPTNHLTMSKKFHMPDIFIELRYYFNPAYATFMYLPKIYSKLLNNEYVFIYLWF